MVTGASSGLGAEMALQLALHEGANLLLVARRHDRLQALQAEIQRQSKAQVRLLVADLSDFHSFKEEFIKSLEDIDLCAAILNAGVTYLGEHKNIEEQQLEKLIRTNVTGVVQLSTFLQHHFLKKAQPAGLLLVSSMAALFPTPYQAVYAGTKSFMLSFTEALRQELKGSELSLTVLLPGGIATEMTDGQGFEALRAYLMPVGNVAKEGIAAFKKRKKNFIPGRSNRWSKRLSFLLPRSLILSQLEKKYRRSIEGRY